MTQLHASPVWGLGSGAAAPRPSPGSLRDADCIVIMGSNMAECHPVAFRWVMQAKAQGRHGHPRRPALHPHQRRWPTSTRRSAPAATSCSSAALIQLRHRERAVTSSDYVVNYTNAATLINDDFQDTEDLDGVFSGLERVQGRPIERLRRPVRAAQLAVRRAAVGDQAPGRPDRSPASSRPPGAARRRAPTPQTLRRAGRQAASAPPPTQRSRRCRTRAASSRSCGATTRATRPRWSSRSTAARRRRSCKVAETLARELRPRPHHGDLLRRRLDAAHHRRADDPRRALLQLLLGNIGRPGGGILALRGHATIQGSTDIADALPLASTAT